MSKARRDVRPIVLDAIEQLREATAVQVHAAVWQKGLSLKQVQSCVYNLQSEGWLNSTGREGAKGSAKGGPVEARYSLAKGKPRPRPTGAHKERPQRPSLAFSSVFAYGQGITTDTTHSATSGSSPAA